MFPLTIWNLAWIFPSILTTVPNRTDCTRRLVKDFYYLLEDFNE